MDFLYKSESVLAVLKPVGVPAQPDPSGDTDIMTAVAGELKKLGESDKLWLVHRLDRVVGGIIVFARTPEAAAELSAIMAGEGTVKKEYLAVVEKNAPSGVLEDYLYADKLRGVALVTDENKRGAKYAKLEAEIIAEKEERTLIRVLLYTGRFHQIRAQLSSRGAPIVGDKKYGSRDRGRRTPALFAYRLNIKMKNETVSVSALPSASEYPWSLFDTEALDI